MQPYYDEAGITIYLADCRDVLPTLGPVDLVLTDPPYFGREDLFATDAVSEVLDRSFRRSARALIFWPCLAVLPARTPDAIHIWHKAIPIHPRSTIGNVAGHHYERILAYGLGSRCEVFRVAAIIPNFAACRDELTIHPTQKPLELVRGLVERFTEPGDLVFDPFGGSGTTARACKDLGRRCILVEQVERYCEIAARRLSQEAFNFAEVAV